MREIRTPRSVGTGGGRPPPVTRWMWKRSHGRTSEAPPDERGGYRYVRPTATASHLDSTHPARCRSLRRGSLNRTYNGHSGPTAGTGLHAPNGSFETTPANGRVGEGFRMPAGRDLSSRTGAGVRKPPRKEPAGSWCAVSGLWGFYGAACWVGDALAGVVGGGSTITVASLPPRQRSPR